KILFLDEPTSGLDPVTSREIHSILIKQREKGTTIFLTTHNMYEAESLCDHIALLR
ncbi:MAG TPA: ABC transporter ATP-binding protein, partial [Lachnospiraceae bacterium]|nr:ABC transporter ATP-binding protein [Lachnospiraceae bacterium]